MGITKDLIEQENEIVQLKVVEIPSGIPAFHKKFLTAISKKKPLP